MNQLQSYSTMLEKHEEVMKFVTSLMKTPHYSKLGADGIYAISIKADSLNIDRFYALNGGLYYLQGKVGMPAESMAAMIREKGHSIMKDSKSSDTVCILHGRRADNGDTWTCSFSIEDAKRAGLYKNSYEKYSNAMVYNRAMSFLARQLFPDIIKGAGYTMDELKEIASNKFEPVPKEKEFEEYITDDQQIELVDVLSECSNEFRDKIMNLIKSEPIKAPSLAEMKVEFYQAIFNRCKKEAAKGHKFDSVAIPGKPIEEAQIADME